MQQSPAEPDRDTAATQPASLAEAERPVALPTSRAPRIAPIVGWGIAALAAGLLVVFAPVLPLLGFAAVVGAIAVDALSWPFRHHLRFERRAAIALTVFALLVATSFGIWAFGPELASQFGELQRQLPLAIQSAEKWLGRQPWLPTDWQSLLGIESAAQRVSVGGILRTLSGAFQGVLGALTALFVVAILSLYLALQPERYVEAGIRLVPPRGRERALEIAGALAQALRWWLVGRFASMIAVGVLTWLGLAMLGVPLAATLGVLAASFSIIPFVGPLLAWVPALLVASLHDPHLALWVTLVYAIVQLLEGNLITPFAEARAVSLPPAAVIAAQAVLGTLMGFMGILLATPIAVVLIVLVQTLYIQDVLGERVRILAARPAFS